MSLFDRLKSDNARMLYESGDMHEITLYNASDVKVSDGYGRFTNPGLSFNSQGLPFAQSKHTIAFHIDKFPGISASETFKDWIGEFSNSQGEVFKGRFNDTLVDKTFGYVSTTLTNIKASV